ncbi:hypothetical protein MBLNU13_g06874t1 [Cladosporium sp. NU13]
MEDGQRIPYAQQQQQVTSTTLPTSLRAPFRLAQSTTGQTIAQQVSTTTRRTAGSIGQVARDAINTELPLGAWAAAAQESSKAPTPADIRKGSFTQHGWTGPSKPARSLCNVSRRTVLGRTSGSEESRINGECADHDGSRDDVPFGGLGSFEVLYNQRARFSEVTDDKGPINDSWPPATQDIASSEPVATQQKPASWSLSLAIGLKAFWRWFLTPLGFLVTIYALNVVAWGGMLFLLLCNAAPAMCWAHDREQGWIHDCDHLYSARRIWMETDSQILNALFCVTGLGLIPWRFRDLYYLLRWRLLSERKYGRQQKLYGLRTLAGIYRGWFRLPGSETLDYLSLPQYNALVNPSHNPSWPLTKYEANLPSVKEGALDSRVPWMLYKTPAKPVTGERALPTALWKVDLFVWCNVANTLLQGCLCGVMWGMSRFDRPSWATGLFIALACVVSGVAGIVSFLEGKRIKKIEGISQTSDGV